MTEGKVFAGMTEKTGMTERKGVGSSANAFAGMAESAGMTERMKNNRKKVFV